MADLTNGNLPLSYTWRDSPGKKQANVLVVDDSRTNRSVLARRLEQQGHRVESAENGRQALDMLAVQPFDLVESEP